MVLQSIKEFGADRLVDGYFARVMMPVRIAPTLAEEAFVAPLARQLKDARLGRVSDFYVEADRDGEPSELVLLLSLSTDAPAALDFVADTLERLDAPEGSTIGNAECAEMMQFGKSHGLGLYLSHSEADAVQKLDVLEACTDAMSGVGLYQGSVSVGDRTAMYFYGDSFNKMRKALTFVISTDPCCKNAFARRLN